MVGAIRVPLIHQNEGVDEYLNLGLKVFNDNRGGWMGRRI
jgi:hypothetical protein